MWRVSWMLYWTYGWWMCRCWLILCWDWSVSCWNWLKFVAGRGRNIWHHYKTGNFRCRIRRRNQSAKNVVLFQKGQVERSLHCKCHERQQVGTVHQISQIILWKSWWIARNWIVRIRKSNSVTTTHNLDRRWCETTDQESCTVESSYIQSNCERTQQLLRKNRWQQQTLSGFHSIWL